MKKQYVQSFLLLTGLAVIVWLGIRYRSTVFELLTAAKIARLIAGILFTAGAMFSTIYIWQRILHFLAPEHKLSFRRVLHVFGGAILGKYIPGGVWEIGGRAYLSRTLGIDAGTALVSTAYELVLSTLAGVLIVLVTLRGRFVATDFLNSNLLIVQIVCASSVCLFLLLAPTYFLRAADFVSKRFNLRIPHTAFLNGRQLIEITFWYVCALLLMSLGYHVFVTSIVSSPVALFATIGPFVLAFTAGVAVFFAPAGVGVREAILVWFLQPLVPLPTAIFIAASSRVMTVIGDVIIFLFAKIL